MKHISPWVMSIPLKFVSHRMYVDENLKNKGVKTMTSELQVRREKISERMKLLQDLVPGCNKVIRAGPLYFSGLVFCLVEFHWFCV